uniref:Bloodthirsty-related gene family, member 1 n=1 Tax=Seriola dumerili TaxID=41447 RepID=A0A3B4TNR6_SERDU
SQRIILMTNNYFMTQSNNSGICLLTEDQFLCPICLDVFTIPVAISCGHTFCKTCITEHWDINTHCQCPVCKQGFHTRPELQVNTLISQIADQLRHELKKVQRYAVDVILNPDTAHPRLILSDDGKEVKHSKIRKNVRDSSDRFSCLYNVLGKRGFSSGRFYYEVQVNANTDWDLGVVRKSINRKGKGPLNPKEGYWAIGLMNGEYTSHADSPIKLPAKPEKVGVFVDYEQGLVSFYDVDTADRIYSFTGCSFTEKLYPFFSHGGKSSTPLILTPVYYNE